MNCFCFSGHNSVSEIFTLYDQEQLSFAEELYYFIYKRHACAREWEIFKFHLAKLQSIFMNFEFRFICSMFIIVNILFDSRKDNVAVWHSFYLSWDLSISWIPLSLHEFNDICVIDLWNVEKSFF